MSEWQPIETAPKDERILLYRPCSYPWATVVFGRFESDRYAKKPRPYWSHDLERVAGVRDARDSPPTHWQPIPALPVST